MPLKLSLKAKALLNAGLLSITILNEKPSDVSAIQELQMLSIEELLENPDELFCGELNNIPLGSERHEPWVRPVAISSGYVYPYSVLERIMLVQDESKCPMTQEIFDDIYFISLPQITAAVTTRKLDQAFAKSQLNQYTNVTNASEFLSLTIKVDKLDLYRIQVYLNGNSALLSSFLKLAFEGKENNIVKKIGQAQSYLVDPWGFAWLTYSDLSLVEMWFPNGKLGDNDISNLVAETIKPLNLPMLADVTALQTISINDLQTYDSATLLDRIPLHSEQAVNCLISFLVAATILRQQHVSWNDDSQDRVTGVYRKARHPYNLGLFSLSSAGVGHSASNSSTVSSSNSVDTSSNSVDTSSNSVVTFSNSVDTSTSSFMPTSSSTSYSGSGFNG